MWNAVQLEEKLLLQKSRINWLAIGDRNSRYFHAKVKGRWNTNKILVIEDSNGEMVQGQEDVQHVAVDFFKGLLGTPRVSPYPGTPLLPQLLINIFHQPKLLNFLSEMI